MSLLRNQHLFILLRHDDRNQNCRLRGTPRSQKPDGTVPARLFRDRRTDLDEHGQYGYYDLDCFWINPNWSAYVIVVEGKWAGFALTNDEVHIQGNTLAIVEFFVVRKYRGKGVGKLAAQSIMDANRGCWEIRILEQNQDARRFWTGLLDKRWSAKYSEALLNNGRWHGPVFSVDTQ